MSNPTLEERARDARRKWGTEEYNPSVGLFEESVQLIVAFAESERRAAQVEALERAARRAAGWTNEFGNPNGTAYEQGQNDMGFRVVSNLLAEAERVKNGESLM